MSAIEQSRISLKFAYIVQFTGETPCFGADICLDGKFIAKSSNRGTGGTTDIRPLLGMEDQVKEAEAFAASLPPVSATAFGRRCEPSGDVLPMSLRLLIELLAADAFLAGTQFC